MQQQQQQQQQQQSQASLAALNWPGASTTVPSAPSALADAVASIMNPTGVANQATMLAALAGRSSQMSNFLSTIPGYGFVDPSVASLLPCVNTATNNATYNPAELLTGAVAQSNPFLNSAAYASAIAALNASRQATAASVAIPPTLIPQTSYQASTSQASNAPNNSIITTGRKREVSDIGEAPESGPTKRPHTVPDGLTNGNSAAMSQAVAALSQANPLTNVIPYNNWYQQQTQSQQLQLQQHQAAQQQAQQTQQLSNSPPITLPTAVGLNDVALQALLMYAKPQAQWPVMNASYGGLVGLVHNPAALYQNAVYAPFTYPATVGTLGQLASNQVQNNVSYINDEGQVLDSLPICRDFKAGKCHRNGECRYVHLIDENVEVNQGRVTVCRDAVKGRCTRIPCRYYHIPISAISAVMRKLVSSTTRPGALSASAPLSAALGTATSPSANTASSSSSTTTATTNNATPTSSASSFSS